MRRIKFAHFPLQHNFKERFRSAAKARCIIVIVITVVVLVATATSKSHSTISTHTITTPAYIQNYNYYHAYSPRFALLPKTPEYIPALRRRYRYVVLSRTNPPRHSTILCFSWERVSWLLPRSALRLFLPIQKV